MAWKSPPSSNPSSPKFAASTPSISAHLSSFNLATATRTLVIPTIRANKRHDIGSPRPNKAITNKLKSHGRSHGSTQFEVVPPASSSAYERNWVRPLGKFEIIQDGLELEGFRIYAVEKWVVERTRFMTVVVVFTGDPQDVITVSTITPWSTLSEEDAQEEYEKATRILRKDGAKPRQTTFGAIMTTSLANFRSDLNIVKIPTGDFLRSRDELYVNLALLRLGCSGRTALNLEKPRDAVKEKFMQLYSIPPVAVRRIPFEAIVLEFIKLIQAALSIFDFFGFTEERDGLLCDMTVDSIQKWTLEIGEKLKELHLEPSERVLDPSVVAGMLSVISSVRSKLVVIIPGGHVLKDPFRNPKAFTETLAQIAPPHMTRLSASPGPPASYLTAHFVEYINRLYRRKMVEGTKPYRITNLNPTALVNLLPTETFSSQGGPSARTTAEAVITETSDLNSFSKSSVVISKDPIETLQLVWTGKIGPMIQARLTQEQEVRVDQRDAGNRSDTRSGDDEDRLFGRPRTALQGISARLQEIGRHKKPSLDATNDRSMNPGHNPFASVSSVFGTLREPSIRHTPVTPHFPVEEPRALSADEGANRSRPFLSLGGVQSSTTESSTHNQGNVSPIHKLERPKTKSLDLKIEKSLHSPRYSSPQTRLTEALLTPGYQILEAGSEDEGRERLKVERMGRTHVRKGSGQGVFSHDKLGRRQSFGDLEKWRDVPHLSLEQMKTDVHMISSLRELRRRKNRVALALDTFKELFRPFPEIRRILRDGLEQQQPVRAKLNEQVDQILPFVENLAAIRKLELSYRKLSPVSPLQTSTPFKSDAERAAQALRTVQYNTSRLIGSEIPNLQTVAKAQRDQFWQQRRLAYLPPERNDIQERIRFYPGSHCPFLWSVRCLYMFMLLAIQWAGMFRRGETKSKSEWRRSTVFSVRLDKKGRTHADLDMLEQEEEEEEDLNNWTLTQSAINADSFAPL